MGLFKAGSAKDLFVYDGKKPTDKMLGSGYIDFNKDDYSVFDRKCSDFKPIPDLGHARYLESIDFMELLNKNGIPNHFTTNMGQGKIGITLVRSLGYDDIVPGETTNYLIPVEFIFSRIVTPIASLHKRLRKGIVKPEDIGLPEGYKPRDDEIIDLPETIVDYSTKIEAADVYRGDVLDLAGLVGNEKERVKQLTLYLSEIVREDARKVDLDIADGKFEFVMWIARNIGVGDTFSGDEPRILYNGVDISKQMQRNYYILIGYRDAVNKAKDLKLPKNEWPVPPPMADEFVNLVSEISKARCERWTRQNWHWDEEPRSLDVLTKELTEYYDKLQDEHGIPLMA